MSRTVDFVNRFTPRCWGIVKTGVIIVVKNVKTNMIPLTVCSGAKHLNTLTFGLFFFPDNKIPRGIICILWFWVQYNSFGAVLWDLIFNVVIVCRCESSLASWFRFTCQRFAKQFPMHLRCAASLLFHITAQCTWLLFHQLIQAVR